MIAHTATRATQAWNQGRRPPRNAGPPHGTAICNGQNFTDRTEPKQHHKVAVSSVWLAAPWPDAVWLMRILNGIKGRTPQKNKSAHPDCGWSQVCGSLKFFGPGFKKTKSPEPLGLRALYA